MFYGKSKRIIVIKDIHSNLFEEAILVLKEDNEKEKCKKIDLINNIKDDFILKEAELIINNYIKDNKGKFIPPKKKEPFIRNSKSMKNLIINSALLGSIVAVVFIIIKLF